MCCIRGICADKYPDFVFSGLNLAVRWLMLAPARTGEPFRVMIRVLLSRLSVLQAAQRDAATLGAICGVVLGVWSWVYVWRGAMYFIN